MKKIILFLCFIFIVPAAAAKPNALCMELGAGAKIIALSADPNGDNRPAIGVLPGGKQVYGVWTLLKKSALVITWDDGSNSVFHLLEFKPCKV